MLKILMNTRHTRNRTHEVVDLGLAVGVFWGRSRWCSFSRRHDLPSVEVVVNIFPVSFWSITNFMFRQFIPFVQEFLTIIITWDVCARLAGSCRRGVVVLLEVDKTIKSRVAVEHTRSPWSLTWFNFLGSRVAGMHTQSPRSVPTPAAASLLPSLPELSFILLRLFITLFLLLSTSIFWWILVWTILLGSFSFGLLLSPFSTWSLWAFRPRLLADHDEWWHPSPWRTMPSILQDCNCSLALVTHVLLWCPYIEL